MYWLLVATLIFTLCSVFPLHELTDLRGTLLRRLHLFSVHFIVLDSGAHLKLSPMAQSHSGSNSSFLLPSLAHAPPGRISSPSSKHLFSLTPRRGGLLALCAGYYFSGWCRLLLLRCRARGPCGPLRLRRMRKQEADARPAAPPPPEVDRCSPAPSGPSLWDSSSPSSRPSLCCPCRGGVLLCAGAAQPHVSFRRCDAHDRRRAPPYSTPTFVRPTFSCAS